jgi:ribosomal-protein-alanine N-acetyltransferase
MIVAPARADQAAALALVHAASFEAGWSEADIIACLTARGGFGLVAVEGDAEVCGFLLVRAIAGEAEILTVAVSPAWRRRGIARALMEGASGLARAAGATTLFLEVACDNLAAIDLYQQVGFDTVGRRRGYYRRPGAAPADALVLRCDLNTASA